MVLTKHLYELEEVRAAFLWSIKQKRRLESVFWLDELEESCYGGEAGRLLWIAWMLWFGPSSLAWLEQWANLSNSRQGRLQLARMLLQIQERDSSFWVAICAKAIGVKEICRAMPSMKDARLDTALSKMSTDLRAYKPFGDVIGQLLAAGILVPTTSWKAFEETSDEARSWLDAQTVREGRMFAIPYDCLYGMTFRGRGSNTADYLRRMDLEMLRRSPFWKRLVPDETDDEAVEEFWDTHFPWAAGDRPDEWPLAEQEKSHGQGATASAESPLSRWWRNWVPYERSCIKGAADVKVKEYMLDKQIGECPSMLDRILTLL
jgi:hypothetical protein